MPALEKAMKAIDKLSKAAITEIKSYAKPPKPVEKVMSAVMVLLEKWVALIVNSWLMFTSTLSCREANWATAKRELSDPNFIHRLQEFVANEKDKISNQTLKLISKYTKQKDFNPDDISTVSLAAGAMCEWVIAMEQYARVFRDVEPK